MKPRWYQIRAVEATIDYVNENPGKHPVIVVPTGGGKTFIINLLVEYLGSKVLILSHNKEILSQNFEALSRYLNEPVGLYSAGLEMKVIHDVTVASIQTIYREHELFSDFDFVLIDEAHLISDKDSSMYRSFLSSIQATFIGLTATPYRLKDGYIYGDGKLFDSVSFEVKSKKLTEEKYLSPLKTYGSKSEFNTEGVATQAGDFKLSDLSLKFDREAISSQIVNDLLQYKNDYKHWLIFCIDIKHAENVSELLNKAGITCEAVHSESPRDQTLLDFKDGKIQAVTNVNILTVGFDFPNIDLIAILRPTKSPTLHVQALGRGLRIAEGKNHCLIKDYSGNIGRLGLVDDVQVLPPAKGKGKGGLSPFMKTCPECELLCYPAVRHCECGYEFKFEHGLKVDAYSTAPKWHTVTNVMFSIHRKPGSPDGLKISYVCGLRVFNDWILLEHSGYAGHKARHMLNNRWKGGGPIPKTTNELYTMTDKIKVPRKIQVDESGKYPKILKTIGIFQQK